MKLFGRKRSITPAPADPVDTVSTLDMEARITARRAAEHGAQCVGTRCPCST